MRKECGYALTLRDVEDRNGEAAYQVSEEIRLDVIMAKPAYNGEKIEDSSLDLVRGELLSRNFLRQRSFRRFI